MTPRRDRRSRWGPRETLARRTHSPPRAAADASAPPVAAVAAAAAAAEVDAGERRSAARASFPPSKPQNRQPRSTGDVGKRPEEREAPGTLVGSDQI